MSDGACVEGGCIAAIFRKGTGVAIFFERFLDRCPIWLCMYWRNVRPDQWLRFIMVVSDSPWSLSAIAPPARSECTPTMLGSIPLLSRRKVLTLFRMPDIMSVRVTEHNSSSCVYMHISAVSVPLLESIWYIRLASALTGQWSSMMHSWWMVCPIFPFFWFEIFSVADSAANKTFRGRFLSSCCWFFQKPTSWTLNWMVRVARTNRPFLFTCLG